MRTAEKLIAERGVENVSIREIVATSGQKNESALQYHFKHLTGLLEAIHTQRAEQVQERRAEALETLLARTDEPELRQVCALMVQPTFELARKNADFRYYIKAFGHKLALSESSPLQAVADKGGGGTSGRQTGSLLRQALPQLDEDTYRRRMDTAILLCSTSMYHQARHKNAFKGKQSDLFLQHLIDALVGLLSVPASAKTIALNDAPDV